MLLAVLLTVWLTPSGVSNGVRLWAWHKGQEQGLTVTIDKIDAPFLRPVVISGLRVTSTRTDAFHIDLTAKQAIFDLNFNRILLHKRGHAIRHLTIEDLRGEIRRDNPAARGITKSGWSTLQKLLPQTLSLASSEIRIQHGPALILVRNCVLSASDVEAGRISAGEVMIASPWLRQTFSQLRGATRWELNRLTLAGLTDHFDGRLHACNFNFRGNLGDPARVTASLWTEMTDFTWRNRTAEAIMLGAALYNEHIQLQQLYIKQKTNQLTLSGQASFPSKSSDWLNPDFRGDISATIDNLGDFTSLFGADSGDFAGKIAMKGALTTRARQLAG